MTIIEKIKARSTTRNRVKGQTKTIIVSILGVVTASGVLDSKPLLKTIVDITLGVLTRDVVNHAITFNK